MKMNIRIGAYAFTATLEKNGAVKDLTEMMRKGPVTIHMEDYSGFEKVGALGKQLTSSNARITTAAGDIVLYNGNKEALIKATCADLRQKLSLARKKNAGILTDFKFF